MREKLIDDNLMLRYLLGDLPETEQLRLEERFFTDDEFYQQMLALEDELKYDYAQGLLTATQRAQFEQRFLATPEKRQQAAVAGLLLDKLSKTDLPPTDAPPARRAWWQAFSALFSLNNPIMQAGLAAAAIAFFLGGSWLLFETARLRTSLNQLETARAGQEQQSQEQLARDRASIEQLTAQLERERAARAELEQKSAQQKEAAAQQQTPPASSAPTLLSFILTPGLARDVAGPKRLVVPASARLLRLQLDLQRPGAYSAYRAVLQTLDGAELWNQDLPRLRKTAVGQAAVINLPARLVPPGDYMVLLKGAPTGGAYEEIEDYYFSTVKQ